MRKQLRNIVKENLPEVLTKELVAVAQEENAQALNSIRQVVVAKLEEIDNRSKDVQSLIIREMASNKPAITQAVSPGDDTAPESL